MTPKYYIEAEEPRLVGNEKSRPWIVGDCESLGQAKMMVRRYQKTYPVTTFRIIERPTTQAQE